MVGIEKKDTLLLLSRGKRDASLRRTTKRQIIPTNFTSIFTMVA